MRRILIWAAVTVTVLVLLFSHRTSTSSTSSATARAGAPRATGGGSSPSAGADAGSGGVAAQPATYAGSVVATRFGNVQVQITVAGGRITEATVLQVPDRDRHDVQINTRAVPILNRAVVAAQGADIDMVSGATVTSEAYVESLQAALDRTHL